MTLITYIIIGFIMAFYTWVVSENEPDRDTTVVKTAVVLSSILVGLFWPLVIVAIIVVRICNIQRRNKE